MNAKRLKTCWHKLPRQTLRELQAKQLRAYLRDVILPFHSYYRDLFRRHGLDWRAIETSRICKTSLYVQKRLGGGAEKPASLSLRQIQSSSRDALHDPAQSRLGVRSHPTGTWIASFGRFS